MYKRNSIRKYFTLILMFFTVVIGFSSWIIVGEKNVTVAQSQVSGPVAFIDKQYDMYFEDEFCSLQCRRKKNIRCHQYP